MLEAEAQAVLEFTEVTPKLVCPECKSWNVQLHTEFNLIFKKPCYFVECDDCGTAGYRYMDSGKAVYDFQHFHGLPKKRD